MAAGPLRGRRVVVTRPRERAGALVRALESKGADVILFPAIEVVGPRDPQALQRAAGVLDEYDWVAFTSVYAVRALAAARAESGEPVGMPRTGCVGDATARAVQEAGWPLTIVPEESTGRGLAEALIRAGAGRGTRVLFPKAEDAREVLPRLLADAGAVVDEVVAYRKRGPEGDAEELRRAMAEGTVDLLTFTSPSTVRNFITFFGDAASGIPVVAIGPTTAEAAAAAGLTVAGVAPESTTEGLVSAVLTLFNA